MGGTNTDNNQHQSCPTGALARRRVTLLDLSTTPNCAPPKPPRSDLVRTVSADKGCFSSMQERMSSSIQNSSDNGEHGEQPPRPSSGLTVKRAQSDVGYRFARMNVATPPTINSEAMVGPVSSAETIIFPEPDYPMNSERLSEVGLDKSTHGVVQGSTNTTLPPSTRSLQRFAPIKQKSAELQAERNQHWEQIMNRGAGTRIGELQSKLLARRTFSDESAVPCDNDHVRKHASSCADQDALAKSAVGRSYGLNHSRPCPTRRSASSSSHHDDPDSFIIELRTTLEARLARVDPEMTTGSIHSPEPPEGVSPVHESTNLTPVELSKEKKSNFFARKWFEKSRRLSQNDRAPVVSESPGNMLVAGVSITGKT